MHLRLFHDLLVADDIGQLREHLRFRNADGFACFWMYHANETELAIMLNGDHAYVHFFPGDGSAGFQAVGFASDDFDDLVDFRADNHEPTPMPRCLTICADQAVKAAEEYFETGERACSLTWAELKASHRSGRSSELRVPLRVDRRVEV